MQAIILAAAMIDHRATDDLKSAGEFAATYIRRRSPPEVPLAGTE
jgi:hypothetical protein